MSSPEEVLQGLYDETLVGNGPRVLELTEEGLALAIDFELLWLQNKRDYYGRMAAEDQARIEMMEARQRARTTVRAVA